MGAPLQLHFPCSVQIFGLDPKYKKTHHEQLFDLIWYGQGRWDWETVYNLPIPLRKLWIQRLNHYLNPPTKKKQDK